MGASNPAGALIASSLSPSVAGSEVNLDPAAKASKNLSGPRSTAGADWTAGGSAKNEGSAGDG